MAEPAEKLYRAEYAKSGRASCKKCGESIAKDSLRLALMVQVPRGGAWAGGGGGGREGGKEGGGLTTRPRTGGGARSGPLSRRRAARPGLSPPRGRAQPIFSNGAFARRSLRSPRQRRSPQQPCSPPSPPVPATPPPPALPGAAVGWELLAVRAGAVGSPGCKGVWRRSGAKFAVKCLSGGLQRRRGRLGGAHRGSLLPPGERGGGGRAPWLRLFCALGSVWRWGRFAWRQGNLRWVRALHMKQKNGPETRLRS